MTTEVAAMTLRIEVTFSNGMTQELEVATVVFLRECAWEPCGSRFRTERKKIYCSQKCAKDSANLRHKLANHLAEPSEAQIRPAGFEKRKPGKRYKNDSWRRRVFKRDGYKCVICGSTDNLEADHVKPCALFPELRNKTENGRTLCNPCHRKTPTYGGRVFRMVSTEAD